MSEQGSNSKITEDHRMALAYHHKGAVQRALDAEKKAKAKTAKLKKLAASEGVPFKTIKDMIALDSPEGEMKMKAELQRQIQVARWSNSDIGTQFSFEDIPNRAPLTERAHEEGRKAGMEGADQKSPYDAPDASNAWIVGWQAGQTLLIESQELFKKKAQDGDAEKQAEAAAKAEKKAAKSKPAETKKPRGRPKKAKGNGAEPEPEHEADAQTDVEDQPQDAA